MNIVDTKENIVNDPKNWLIHLMDFVDDFRREQEKEIVTSPLKPDNERIDAILASVVHYLCDELKIDVPEWVYDIPACKDPWFVSGMENLKAIAIVESPIHFRIRKIFVLENFLSRA